MSLSDKITPTLTLGFPRVSGDEPLSIEALLQSEAFSPRERG